MLCVYYGHRDEFVLLSALNEIGHGLSKLKEGGWRPRRTIVLASWGAEVNTSDQST